MLREAHREIETSARHAKRKKKWEKGIQDDRVRDYLGVGRESMKNKGEYEIYQWNVGKWNQFLPYKYLTFIFVHFYFFCSRSFSEFHTQNYASSQDIFNKLKNIKREKDNLESVRYVLSVQNIVFSLSIFWSIWYFQFFFIPFIRLFFYFQF